MGTGWCTVDLRHNPFPLIFTRGDEATKLVCLKFFDLERSPKANECLSRLIEQQRAAGAFPSAFDPGEWGMQETVRHTLLLLKVGMPPQRINIHQAVRFILHHQKPDGGWSENRALRLPPERTWLSNERSITWLTADVVDLLRRVGMGKGRECQAALELLRKSQNQQGGWPSLADETGERQSDPDATAQITFLMGEIYEENDAVHRKGKALFESYLEESVQEVKRGYWRRRRDGHKEELDVYTLTHLLLSWLLDPPRRFRAGYNAGDPRVRRMMEALIDVQREDGGWRPFFATESSPVYTLLAVKALVLSGVLTQDELQSGVGRYAFGHC